MGSQDYGSYHDSTGVLQQKDHFITIYMKTAVLEVITGLLYQYVKACKKFTEAENTNKKTKKTDGLISQYNQIIIK